MSAGRTAQVPLQPSLDAGCMKDVPNVASQLCYIVLGLESCETDGTLEVEFTLYDLIRNAAVCAIWQISHRFVNLSLGWNFSMIHSFFIVDVRLLYDKDHALGSRTTSASSTCHNTLC